MRDMSKFNNSAISFLFVLAKLITYVETEILKEVYLENWVKLI